MVLAIKLQDNIFVPQVIIDKVKHIFGANYLIAQNSIKGIYNTKDETSFESKLYNQIVNSFNPSLVFNLYHLVDSQKMSDIIISNKKTASKYI